MFDADESAVRWNRRVNREVVVFNGPGTQVVVVRQKRALRIRYARWTLCHLSLAALPEW